MKFINFLFIPKKSMDKSHDTSKNTQVVHPTVYKREVGIWYLYYIGTNLYEKKETILIKNEIYDELVKESSEIRKQLNKKLTDIHVMLENKEVQWLHIDNSFIIEKKNFVHASIYFEDENED